MNSTYPFTLGMVTMRINPQSEPYDPLPRCKSYRAKSGKGKVRCEMEEGHDYPGYGTSNHGGRGILGQWYFWYEVPERDDEE